MFVLYCKSVAHCAHDFIVGLYENSFEIEELLFNFFVYQYVAQGLNSRDFVFGFSLEDKELTEEELGIFREIYSKNEESIEANRGEWTGNDENSLENCEISEMWYAYYDVEDESDLSIVDKESREEIGRILGVELE